MRFDGISWNVNCLDPAHAPTEEFVNKRRPGHISAKLLAPGCRAVGQKTSRVRNAKKIKEKVFKMQCFGEENDL